MIQAGRVLGQGYAILPLHVDSFKFNEHSKISCSILKGTTDGWDIRNYSDLHLPPTASKALIQCTLSKEIIYAHKKEVGNVINANTALFKI